LATMFMPCNNTTRPSASVSHRPEWPIAADAIAGFADVDTEDDVDVDVGGAALLELDEQPAANASVTAPTTNTRARAAITTRCLSLQRRSAGRRPPLSNGFVQTFTRAVGAEVGLAPRLLAATTVHE
jgi:hypothetical protein